MKISQSENNNNNSLPQDLTKKYENIPIYKQLYPPLIDEISNEPQNILALIAQKQKSHSYNNNDEEMNQEFLDDLVKKSNLLSKNKFEIISKFIEKTKLIEKMEINKKFKQMEISQLSLLLAQKFTYEKFKKNQIIFKIGDPGDRFYFILKGKVSILKLKELPNIYMKPTEYLNYLVFLINNNEEYLFNEMLEKNNTILPVTNEHEVLSLYKILFKNTLKENISKKLINNNKILIEFFRIFEQNYSDYNINISELEIIEMNKKNNVKNSEKDWQHYLLKKCELSDSESIFFDPYVTIFKNTQKNKITCYVYESFLFLGPGFYFGDFALDSDFNKRNATVRAEEDTFFGWLRSVDYINMIAPKRRFEKMKEIAYLYDNFFFKNINPHIFEKKYFHLFSPRIYKKGTELFFPGNIIKKLILIKEGQVKLEMTCSVLDLQKLIKYLYKNIISNKYFSKYSLTKKKMLLSAKKMSNINKYINEPIFRKLQSQKHEFLKEIQKVQNFHISIVSEIEVLSLEEIFLKIPYLMKGTVCKTMLCYELAVEQVEMLLREEKEIIFDYVANSIRKIVLLIERIQSIKKNCIDLAISKCDNVEDYFYDEIDRTINDSIDHNFTKKTNTNKIKSEEADKTNKDLTFRKINLIRPKSRNNNSNISNSPIKSYSITSNINYNYLTSLFIRKKNTTKLNKLHKNISFYSNNNKSNQKNKTNLTVKKSFSSSSFSKIFENTNNLSNTTLKFSEKNYYTTKNIFNNQNNIFKLGDNKYVTIKKLQKEMREFNSLDNSKHTLEIIQSNQFQNNQSEINNNSISLSDSTSFLNTKKNNSIKWSQDIKNFRLSFVPFNVNNNISPSYDKYFNLSFLQKKINEKIFNIRTAKNFNISRKTDEFRKLNRVRSLGDFGDELPKIKSNNFIHYYNFYPTKKILCNKYVQNKNSYKNIMSCDAKVGFSSTSQVSS